MTIDDLILYGKKYVHKDHVFLLLSELLKINILDIFNHLEDKVSSKNIERFKKQIALLKDGKPIQYVIGSVNFYGYNFFINQNVLIPRFETEGLVLETYKLIKANFKNKNLKILDLGTGSGVIGLTLKKLEPNFQIDLVDISEKALEVASYNCKKLGVDANIIKSDFFENINSKYDVIISNPPYIKYDEEIEDVVKNNEPHIALYAKEDGLYCYKQILKNISNHLNSKYIIAFEIGMTQKKDVENLINKYLKFSQIYTKKDLNNRDRYIFVTNFE